MYYVQFCWILVLSEQMQQLFTSLFSAWQNLRNTFFRYSTLRFCRLSKASNFLRYNVRTLCMVHLERAHTAQHGWYLISALSTWYAGHLENQDKSCAWQLHITFSWARSAATWSSLSSSISRNFCTCFSRSSLLSEPIDSGESSFDIEATENRWLHYASSTRNTHSPLAFEHFLYHIRQHCDPELRLILPWRWFPHGFPCRGQAF